MLFGEKKLENYIVPAIAEAGSLSATEIHDAVVERFGPCSPQAVYKALSVLSDTGVIVKSATGFSLNLQWCLEVVDFADSLLAVSLSDKHFSRELPVGKRKAKWHFKSLYRLNHFWCHLILCTTRSTDASLVHSWNPHPWFYLMRSAQEKHYLSSLDEKDISMRKVCGGRTPLDEWSTSFWQGDGVEYCFNSGSFDKLMNTWLNVINDYVIYVVLDDDTCALINSIYDEVASHAELTPARLAPLFDATIEGSIEIFSNAKEAAKLVELFDQAFAAST